jgi:predicted SAM-dependent methyltransferase
MIALDFIKSFGWNVVNPFLLKIKKNRKYTFPSNYNGLNIGCGLHNPPNWVGIDGGFSHYVVHRMPKFLLKPFFNNFNMAKNYSFNEYYSHLRSFKLIHHELTYQLPFSENAVPNIYSSHFFEHLFKEQAENLLKDCYRVLKPGGRIRICVPSLEDAVGGMEQAIALYKKGDVDTIQTYLTSEIVGFNSVYSNHRFMYDAKTLIQVLETVGFNSVERFSEKEGKIVDVALLDTRGGIFIEGSKPE